MFASDLLVGRCSGAFLGSGISDFVRWQELERGPLISSEASCPEVGLSLASLSFLLRHQLHTTRIYLYKESVLNCAPRHFKTPLEGDGAHVEASQFGEAHLQGKDPNYIIEIVKILQDVVCLPGVPWLVKRFRADASVPLLVRTSHRVKAKTKAVTNSRVFVSTCNAWLITIATRSG